MKSDRSPDTVLSLEFFPDMAEGIPRKKVVFPFSPYQMWLFFGDLVITGLAFYTGALLTGAPALAPGQWPRLAILFLAALVMIAFFPNYRLYSYHLIFSPEKHLAGLAKAFCWSLLVFGLIAFLYTWPVIFREHAIITGAVILSLAAGLLVLSRFVWGHMLNIVKAMGVGFIIAGVSGMLLENEVPALITNPTTVLAAVPLAIVALGGFRFFLVHVVYNIWMRRRFRRQVAVVGSNEDAGSIVDHILRLNAPYWVTGFVGEGGVCRPAEHAGKECIGSLNKLPQLVEDLKLDEIIVTDETIDPRTLIALLDYCTSMGVIVWFPPKLLPIIDMKLYVDDFCGMKMIRMCSQRNSELSGRIKHALDALITLPLFVLQLPLFGAIAAAVKLDSKGPVFYKAKAIGKGGRPFRMYKFRSMYTDQSSDIHKQYVTKLIKGEIGRDGGKSGPLKITNDPRVTRVGRILRKLSLDELPQLINVLRGEMSLIGPRPCLPYEYEIYKDWHKKRNSVRPGITGLWQVTGRSEVSFEEMILLDLYYIYNRNLMLDLSILYETIFVVLAKKGAF